MLSGRRVGLRCLTEGGKCSIFVLPKHTHIFLSHLYYYEKNHGIRRHHTFCNYFYILRHFSPRSRQDFASGFLGRKYRYGATGPKTFDCSGFTSYVFRNIGIELPRTSRMQYGLGEKIERTDLREGDLVFFSSPSSGRGKVGHVGIVVDVDPETHSMTFIHASNSKGITYQKFPDGGYFSRNYIGAKRVLDDNTNA